MVTLEEAYAARSGKVNKIETLKQTKSPMEVYARLEQIAEGGYEALAKEDSAFFLKCFGLFDKGEHFMLRVRIPGGRLTASQAIRIGEVAKEFGRDYIDLTTRMQVELRYIAVENIATVLKRLDEAGITTFQTGVDNLRNILTDPLDGFAHDNVIECYPLLETLQDIFLKKEEWIAVLPRKFNTAILGSLSNSCNIFGHDCGFVLAQKEGVFGFHPYLGGKVGEQARAGGRFLQIDEVAPFYEALLKVYKRYGYRDNRNKNRLHFLIEDVGVETLMQAIEEEAGTTFEHEGITMTQSLSTFTASVRVLGKNGNFAYKLIAPSGVFSGTDMIAVAETAQRFGSDALRIGYDQNLWILDIKPQDTQAFEASDIMRKYSPYNTPYFKDMIACAGLETCDYGLIPNKPDAHALSKWLEEQIPIPDGEVRINWSACPKGCGVHGIADIGLEGAKVKLPDKSWTHGAHLFIGGKITRSPKEAYRLHKGLPLSEVRYHVKYLLEAYRDFRLTKESFEEFESRYLSASYSYQAIAFYTKINYILRELLGFQEGLALDKEPKTSKREEYEIFHFGLKLYKLLTGEKRFEAVEGLSPVLVKPRSIARDTVSKLNPKVPLKLSEIIYEMTHEKKSERAQVFSEILVRLNEVEQSK